MTRRKPDRASLEDLDWLVTRRNKIQSLMLLLLQRWRKIQKAKRPDAVAAVFSLWRAAFLLVAREKGQSDKKVESTALETLERVVRTNAISFSDDLVHREWTGSASHRIGRLINEKALDVYAGAPRSSVREAWDAAYELLHAFVTGTLWGTLDANQASAGNEQSA